MSYEKIGNIIDNTKAETKKKWQQSSTIAAKLNVKNRILTSKKTLANDVYNKKSEGGGGNTLAGQLVEEFTQISGQPAGFASAIVGREYYDYGPDYYVSPSGLHAFSVKNIKTIRFLDGNNEVVTLNLALQAE